MSRERDRRGSERRSGEATNKDSVLPSHGDDKFSSSMSGERHRNRYMRERNIGGELDHGSSIETGEGESDALLLGDHLHRQEQRFMDDLRFLDASYDYKHTARLALYFLPIWFAANYTFNVALGLTSVSSTSVLSNSSPFFTLVGEL